MCEANGKDPGANSPAAQLPRPPAHVCTSVIITVVQLHILRYTSFSKVLISIFHVTSHIRLVLK